MGQLPSIIYVMNKTLLGILCLHICLLIGLSQSRQARMDSEWKSKRSISARDGGHQKFPSPEVDPCERKKRSEQSGRDGGQQKFPSPLVDFHPNGVLGPNFDFDPNSLVLGKRDGGHPKFPSPEVDENVDDPCSRKKRSIDKRDGGQQKFPSPDPCNLKKRSEQSGRDGGHQKFSSPEVKRSEQSGRDGGQQKFPSPLVDFHPYGVLNPHGDFDPNSFYLGKRSIDKRDGG